jgi:AcrR family transcriptional regulator
MEAQGGTQTRIDRREGLLVIAMRLFSERSYEDVSIDEVAAQAGVAKGLLYYYFGSKRGLYATGLERLAAELRDHTLAATAELQDLPPIELLAAAIDAHLSYVEERAAGYRALLGSVGAHPEIRTILEGERTFRRTQIEQQLPPEIMRGPALTIALKGWLSFVDGAVFAWLEDRVLDRPQVLELCMRAFTGSVIAASKVDEKRRNSSGSRPLSSVLNEGQTMEDRG